MSTTCQPMELFAFLTLVKVHVVLICVACCAFWSPVLVQCS